MHDPCMWVFLGAILMTVSAVILTGCVCHLWFKWQLEDAVGQDVCMHIGGEVYHIRATKVNVDV